MANSGSKIVLATLLGAAAGVMVGLLLAPEKGSKTRKRLKKRFLGIADMMQGDLSEKLNAFKSVFTLEKEEPAGVEPNTIEMEEK